jgi:tetratricopeptide (TPR) repeat protein
LLQSEALRLFVERGTAARQSFALTVENAGAVLQLCRRLDGIPLALELAAARLQALSVEQILTRLEDRFRLLADGARTAPPRQQTLRAALDWSYTLLTDAERILIHRLSIFAGGWTLEAAEAVCGEEGLGCWGLGLGDGAVGGTPPDQDTTSQDLRPKPQDLRPYGVLDLLTALVDKSLVQYEEPGEGKSGRDTRRYRLLETVRQYARERLLESGEAEAVRDRHLAFYLPLAEDAACHLRGPGQLAALERLDTEHDNLRAALDWSLTEGRNQKVVATDREGATDSHQPRLPSAFCLLPSAPEAAFRLAGALAGFWEVRGHVEEGRRRLAAVLDQTAPPDAAPNPKSRIQNPKSQQPRRRSHAAAVALEGAGALAILQWDYAAARAHYTESLEIRRALDDRRGVARSLGRLGLLAFEQGDGPDAYAQLQESLGIARELGDPAGLSGALGTLAHVAFRQGDILWARALLEESLAIERELGDPAGIALALTGLAEIVHHLEEYPLARALEEESLAIGRVLGDRRRVAESLVLLGNTLYAQQEYAAARTHLEEALAIQRALGDGRRAAEALDALANMARRQGDYAAGRRFAEECVALWRATGAQVGVIHALGVLGHLARATREYRQAHTAYSESLRLRDEGQHLYLVINGLEDFADLANDQEQWERAMRLLGAALAQREAAGKPLLPRERADYDAIACRARGALAEEVVAAAFSDGQGMTREQAIAYALAAPPLDEEEAEVTETAHPPRADAIGPLRVVSAGSAQ